MEAKELDAFMQSELDRISLIEDDETRSKAIDSFTKLLKSRTDAAKAEWDDQRKGQELTVRKIETESAERQTRSQNIVKYVGYGVEVFCCLAGIAATGTLFAQGLKFEEKGSISAQMNRWLMNRIRFK